MQAGQEFISSARDYKWILYLENLGRAMEHPIEQKTKMSNLGTLNFFLPIFSVKMNYPPKNIPKS